MVNIAFPQKHLARVCCVVLRGEYEKTTYKTSAHNCANRVKKRGAIQVTVPTIKRGKSVCFYLVIPLFYDIFQQVRHAVLTCGLSAKPRRRFYRAGCKYFARSRRMGKGDNFVFARKHYFVFAHYGTAAYRVYADLAFFSFAR